MMRYCRTLHVFVVVFSMSFWLGVENAKAAEQSKITEQTPAAISVEASLDQAFVTIGTKITYRLSVRHDSDIRILDINVSESLKDFEVQKNTPFSVQEGSAVREGREIVMTTYQIGEYVLEPAIVSYSDSVGQQKTIQSNKLYLSVESVDKNVIDPSEDIAPLKGVVPFRSSRFAWMVTVLFIAGALLALGIWWYWKKRMITSLLENESNILPPYEEALQALLRLVDSDLIRRGLMKEYFAALSDILRRYFERRYSILALELTTEELLGSFTKRMDFDKHTYEEIETILKFSDLVKFAKYKPEPKEVLQMNMISRKILEETRPALTIDPAAPAEAGQNDVQTS